LYTLECADEPDYAHIIHEYEKMKPKDSITALNIARLYYENNDETHFEQYYNDSKEQGVLLTLANDSTDENGELRFLSGWLFEKGISVPKDIEMAKELYSKSEEKGFPLSTKYLKRIS